MKATHLTILVVFVCAGAVGALADTFGTGANQFTIDFVPIAGDAGGLGSWPAGSDYTFTGVESQRLPHGHVRDHQRPVDQVHEQPGRPGDGRLVVHAYQ